jgi:alkaline phosphatase
MRVAWALALLGACQAPPRVLGEPFPAEVVCDVEPVPTGTIAMPRNMIVVMGDGMGPVQVEGGRLQRGAPLDFESLSRPVWLNSDSITTDRSSRPDDDPTDAAAAATAMFTGVRTLNERIGVDADGAPLASVAEHARAAGKSVGVVTNSFVYDASPAALYAHVLDRASHQDIVMELLTTARPEIVFGGGRPLFEAGGGTFLALAADAGYAVLDDAADLAAWDPAAAPRALGLFQGSAVSPAPALWEWFTTPVALRDASSTDPRLPDMAARALDALSQDPDGFLLFVENEHIDTLGHIALIERELVPHGLPLEVVELDGAYAAARAWVDAASSFDDTLLVVTADHETGGYTLDGDLDDPYFWATPFHTRQPIALYAQGPGADRAGAMCRTAHLYWLLTGQLP